MFIRPALLDPKGPNDGPRYMIRDPLTMRHLAAEGEEKPGEDYWLRRLQEGGVEIVEPAMRPDEGTHPAALAASEPAADEETDK